MFVILASMLVAPALSSFEQTALVFDVADTTTRPVTKVVKLLKDMAKQMEKEAEEDLEVYDATMCWCETNRAEKTKAIAEQKAQVEDLNTKIETLTSLSAQTTTEIKDAETEKKADQDALDTAISLRAKQLKEFNAAEKDMLLTISSLKSALTILAGSAGKSGTTQTAVGGKKAPEVGGAFLQVKKAMQDPVLDGILTPSARRAMAAAFAQAPGYAPEGGEIFGVLNQMKETFETNLANSQKEEKANQKAFDDLKQAKEDEIGAGVDQIDAKTNLLADTDEKNAQAAENLADTSASLKSDEEFLASLEEKCKTTEVQWQERLKDRATEMTAVQKAIATLDSDDAHSLFSKSLPTFAQKESTVHSERRAQASKVLMAVADQVQNPRLSTLAMAVRLDAFVKVKKAIDDMITNLKAEKAEEVKKKDFCIEEFHQMDLTNDKKTREKADVLALISDLQANMQTLTDEIKVLTDQIAELNKQMAAEGANRQKQNSDFQMVVSDQRASQKLLNAALNVLKAVYGSAMVETSAVGGPPPPPGFDKMKKSDAGGGVMGMIQKIINDAVSLEREAMRDEQSSQKEYEEFVSRTNDSINKKQQSLDNKTATKAQKEADLIQAIKSRDATLLELEQLANQKADTHESCDFVVKNFEIRQAARDQEVDALRQAKGILSGAKFDAFLQEH